MTDSIAAQVAAFKATGRISAVFLQFRTELWVA
jgi:hypothetical protein